jgi:hypothetical protein
VNIDPKSELGRKTPLWRGKLALASRQAMTHALQSIDKHEFLDRLSPAAREHHTEPLIATGWYPERPAAEVLEVGALMLNRPLYDLAYEIGAQAMDYQYGGIAMGLAAIFVTPRQAVRYGPTNWTKYRTTGTLSSRIEREGLILSSIQGWTGHCPTLCCATWGAFDRIWRSMKRIRPGRTNRVQCVSTGAPACVFEFPYQL